MIEARDSLSRATLGGAGRDRMTSPRHGTATRRSRAAVRHEIRAAFRRTPLVAGERCRRSVSACLGRTIGSTRTHVASRSIDTGFRPLRSQDVGRVKGLALPSRFTVRRRCVLSHRRCRSRVRMAVNRSCSTLRIVPILQVFDDRVTRRERHGCRASLFNPDPESPRRLRASTAAFERAS